MDGIVSGAGPKAESCKIEFFLRHLSTCAGARLRLGQSYSVAASGRGRASIPSCTSQNRALRYTPSRMVAYVSLSAYYPLLKSALSLWGWSSAEQLRKLSYESGHKIIFPFIPIQNHISKSPPRLRSPLGKARLWGLSSGDTP